MSHELEDLQAKTNKLAEEAGSIDTNSPEHRENLNDGNNQTTTISTNHYQSERFERGCFIHLYRWPPSLQLQAGSTDEDVKIGIGKTRQTLYNSEISLEIFRTTQAVSINQPVLLI
uniref:Uncharacterized protein n=1 Tax=Trichobilharzia regenti TaxID=157069 RepID=A0AA85K9H7_TRIRE|nr:unnamed protein product [Trichobilharzia regenti]